MLALSAAHGLRRRRRHCYCDRPLKTPATIAADTRCNNACRFCEVVDPTTATPPYLDDDAVLALVAEQAEAGRQTLIFTGGELTLRKPLLGWLEAAKSGGIDTVVLRTNGRMLAYKAFVEQIRTAGVDRVEVALHGPTPEVHEWLTRAEGSFSQALKGLRNVARAGCATAVNTVLTRSNYRHLSQFVPLLARARVGTWVLHELRPLGDGVANRAQLQAPWPMMQVYVRRAAKLAARHGIGVQLVRAASAQQDDVR